MCEGHGPHPHHEHGAAAELPLVEQGLKIAVTGKGGVGKTTLSAMLARAFAAEGRRVLAIDADPDANLASALGLPEEARRQLRPLSRMHELAQERTGATPGFGGMFRLDPPVGDLPEAHGVVHAGVRLLLMGTVEQAGSGCACPEHTLLKSLVRHLLLERDDVVILDMEAGVEHLGRGTAQGVDVMVVVVEPGLRSFQTARQVTSLARELGVERVVAVASKVRGEADLALIVANLPELALLGSVSQSDEIRRSDADGTSAYDVAPAARAEAIAIRDAIVAHAGPRSPRLRLVRKVS